jgi:pimeloyl-ACP methyl ester carboxylesterase
MREPRIQELPPRLRRAYFDCRYGQLHVHNAIPAGGGFDELTAVICVPGAGETGRVFLPQLQVLGARRSVYALDLPGSGESDPAPAGDALQAGIHAVMDFAGSMRIRRFDLIARASGCDIARGVRERMIDSVRRMVLHGDLASPRAVDASVKYCALAQTLSAAALLEAFAGPT